MNDLAPRLPIGRWPTPVRRLDALSQQLGCDVWAKLEDQAAWGGNKVRKLEYLLAEARADEATRLVAYGAGASSWAAATAFYGDRFGFEVTVALAGALPDEHARLYEELGTKVLRAPRLAALPLVVAAARASARNQPAKLLPVGGSGGIGDLGSLRAGLELADQIGDGGVPRPAAVYVAAGTGGTAAGLAVGLGMKGLWVPVVAARVTPRPLGSQRLLRRRIREVKRRVGSKAVPAPLVVEDRFFAPGYGKPSNASRAAQAAAGLDGLDLDPVYAAKAFAVLLHDARRGARAPLLFLHTSVGDVPAGSAA